MKVNLAVNANNSRLSLSKMPTGRRRTCRRYKRRTTAKRTGAGVPYRTAIGTKVGPNPITYTKQQWDKMHAGQKMITFDQWCKQPRRVWRASRGLGNP